MRIVDRALRALATGAPPRVRKSDRPISGGPFYDDRKGGYRVICPDGRVEEGPLAWCVAEATRTGLHYRFSDGDHGHSFEEALAKVVDSPGVPGIEGDRGQYSPQELRMIDALHELLHGAADLSEER